MFEEFGVFIYTTREMACGGQFFRLRAWASVLGLGAGPWTLGGGSGSRLTSQRFGPSRAAPIALLGMTMRPSSLWIAGRLYQILSACFQWYLKVLPRETNRNKRLLLSQARHVQRYVNEDRDGSRIVCAV